jgi:hypothetical protein
VVLKNLQLKPAALAKLNLPVVVQSGVVGTLRLKARVTKTPARPARWQEQQAVIRAAGSGGVPGAMESAGYAASGARDRPRVPTSVTAQARTDSRRAGELGRPAPFGHMISLRLSVSWPHK